MHGERVGERVGERGRQRQRVREREGERESESSSAKGNDNKPVQASSRTPQSRACVNFYVDARARWPETVTAALNAYCWY